MKATIQSKGGSVKCSSEGMDASMSEVQLAEFVGFSGRGNHIQTVRVTGDNETPRLAVVFDNGSALILRWSNNHDAFVLQRSKPADGSNPARIEHLVGGSWRPARDLANIPRDATTLEPIPGA